MADHGFDGRAAPQFALDGAEDASLLSGDEDAAWMWRIVASVSFVDIGTLDLAASEVLRVLDDRAQGVTVIWIARQRLGVQNGSPIANRVSIPGRPLSL